MRPFTFLAAHDHLEPALFEGSTISEPCRLTKIRRINSTRPSFCDRRVELTKQLAQIEVGRRRNPSGDHVLFYGVVMFVVDIRAPPAART
jgi:hypothetical protein